MSQVIQNDERESVIKQMDNQIKTLHLETDYVIISKRRGAMKDKLDEILARIESLNEKYEKVEQRLDAVEQRLDSVEHDIANVKLTLENEVRTNIIRIAEGHFDLSRVLTEAVKTNDEMIMLTIKGNRLDTDVRELKRKIAELAS